MKNIVLSMLLIVATAIQAQVSFGKSELINSEWKFINSDTKEAQQKDFNDEKWRSVNLPHDWSIEGVLSPDKASATGFLPGGIAWYRKVLEIPIDKKEQKVFIYFEGVYNRSDVYINGKHLGHRPNGYISFMYDITDQVEFGAKNTIAVKVDHSRSADSRWYTGSGIYRDAYLIYSNQIHIAQWGVQAYPTISNTKKGELTINLEIKNESNSTMTVNIINKLTNDDGIEVGSINKSVALNPGITKISGVIKIKNPQLWSTEHPNLYQLTTQIKAGNEVLDQTSTSTGFRNFRFDPNQGFFLNEKNMKIKGVCLHHDGGVLGSAMYSEVWRDRLVSLKKLGVNAIRTSHNPQAPHLYQLCDELGLLVMNEAYDEWEFPKRKWLQGWNFGTPGFEGNFDYFEEWGEKDLADFVRRDRNHISVFAWSIGNEVDYPNDPYSHPVLAGGAETGFTQPIFGGFKKDAPDAMRLGIIAKKLAKVVRENDPYRPVTAGLAGVAMSNQTEYPGALDICGYNYTESLYDSDHKKYPKRVIYGSENRHDIDAWKAVTDRNFIAGQFLWTGVDYLGESGRWPSRGFYSGLVDFAGNIKPRGYFRQSLWSENPMIYAGTYPIGGRTRNSDVLSSVEPERRNQRPSIDAWPIWNYEEGQNIRVVVYTNAPSAQLLLNGSVVGDLKDYDHKTGVIYWDIPYREGRLEVQGINNGKIESSYAIESSARPYALIISNKDELKSSTAKIVQVKLQIVDENGRAVILADNEIRCRIQGQAELLGLEAGNNEDMGDYNDNQQRAYHGKLVAYIKLKSEKVKLTFSSPLLKSASIEL